MFIPLSKDETLEKLYLINARYDNYKREFYLLGTEEFAGEWSEIIKYGKRSTSSEK